MNKLYMKRIFYSAVLLLLAGCGNKADDTFTLWQLPSTTDNIGNSYVIQTPGGKLIVMDGGFETERNYLRGFIDALGGVDVPVTAREAAYLNSTWYKWSLTVS